MIAGAPYWLTAPRNPPVWLAGAALTLSAAACIGLAAWPSGAADSVSLKARCGLGGLCAMIAAMALVIAKASAPAGYARICALGALIDAGNLAHEGGA
jgi:hypothetical protein